MAPTTSPRTNNKIENHDWSDSIYNPAEIHLQYLSIVERPCKNYSVVFVEDLSVRNMSKSESGSQEKHGTNVKQKSGLNRETRRIGILSLQGRQDLKFVLVARRPVSATRGSLPW
jgi:hypothetical protein